VIQTEAPRERFCRIQIITSIGSDKKSPTRKGSNPNPSTRLKEQNKKAWEQTKVLYQQGTAAALFSLLVHPPQTHSRNFFFSETSDKTTELGYRHPGTGNLPPAQD
jgi:hypothetical protein